MPRAFSATAIARGVVPPAACICRMIGNTLAAKASKALALDRLAANHYASFAAAPIGHRGGPARPVASDQVIVPWPDQVRRSSERLMPRAAD
jgi:hypothetical protein